MNRFFHVNNIHNIAIYGYNEISVQLFDEVYGGDIKIPLIVDEKYKGVFNMLPECKFISMEELKNYNDIDAVIISEEDDYKNKMEAIQKYYSGIVTSIDRLVRINSGTD